VLQEVHIELFRLLGEHYLKRIGNTLGNSPWGATEHEALVKAVARALSRVRTTADKRKSRGLPQEFPLVREVEADFQSNRLIELTIDLGDLIASFDELERQIWQRSMSGQTIRDIAVAVGIMHYQRVGEILKQLQQKVAALLDASENHP